LALIIFSYYPLSPFGWFDASDIAAPQQAIIWQLRAPRVAVAAMVGASLGAAGAQMQGLFRNPLASPDIIGTSADVAQLADRFVTELSGGERQRVLLARSLATEVPILLLDEPTASLDIAHALDVLNLYRELAEEGKSIAVAIHDINLAARFADRVALLDEGRLIAFGNAHEVLRVESLNRVFGVSTDRLFTDDGKPVFVFHRDIC
jgi:ABC-type hemin transport system ATPase subunit